MAPQTNNAYLKEKTDKNVSKIPVKSTFKGKATGKATTKTDVKYNIKNDIKSGKKSETSKPRDPEDSIDKMEFEEQNLKRKRGGTGSGSEGNPSPPMPSTPTKERAKQARFDDDSSSENEVEIREPEYDQIKRSTDIPKFAYVQQGVVKEGLDMSTVSGRRAVNSLDALMEIIASLTAQCAKLEGKVEMMMQLPQETNTTEPTKTYANITQKLRAPGLPAKAQPASKEKVQTIFLKPKNTKDFENMHEAKTHLMKVFNPNTERVRIQNVRTTKNGIIIETPTESEASKLGLNKSLGKSFSVEKPRKRLPRLVIYDVPKDMTETSVSDSIFGQNVDLASSVEQFQAEFCPKFKTGKKEGRTVNWVVEVSPLMRNKILGRRRLYVEWSACRVRDFVMVTRCYKCQGFGHLAKHCERETCCSLCAETGHKGTECPKKEEKQEHKCVNCFKSKKPHGHSTLDKNCPAYKQALERLVDRIDYGL